MPAWSAKKLFHGFIAFGSAYLLGGGILNAVGNAMAHINWWFTIIGTVAMPCIWFGLQSILKRHPADFGGYNIKHLGYVPACGLVGIFLLLWTPPTIHFLSRLRPIPGPATQAVLTKTKEANVVVLVSEFAGINPQAYGVTDIIFEQLTDAVKAYPDVKIKRLREPIETTEIAQSKGKDSQVDIVLWGSYLTNQAQTRVSINFEVLDKTFDIPLHQGKETVTASTAKLASFTIQEGLSRDMTYLVLLTLGIVRLEGGDYDGATARFTHALTLSTPSDLVEPHVIHDYRAYCYFMKKEFDEAISDYTSALRYKREPRNLFMRGFAYFIRGDYDRSLRDLTDSLALRQNDQVYALRAFYYLIIKTELKQALEDSNKGLELNPDNVFCLMNRGGVYLAQEKYDLAISDFEKIVTFEVEGESLSSAYNNLGLAYEAKGEIGKAIDKFSLAMETDPENPNPYYNRANLYSKHGLADKALHDIEVCISLAPKRADAYAVRGNVYKLLGELDKALAEYTTAISLSARADAYGFYYNRGLIYHKKGDLDRAILDYTESVKLNPNWSESYVSRCYAYRQKGQLDFGISDCNKATQLDPNNPKPYLNRGLLFGMKYGYARAVPEFNRAIELDPNNALAYLDRGAAYAAQGKQNNAVVDFKKAIELGDNDVAQQAKEALCQLGAGSCQ